MEVSEAIQTIKDNMNAHQLGCGYSHNIIDAVAVLHQEWFKQPMSYSCKPCVISCKNRVFNYYQNTYKIKHDTSAT